MKIEQEQDLTFRDSITAANQVWGAGQAEQMVRLAINARPAVFRELLYCLISSAKGRSV
jgi:hypothetical protein